MPSIGVLGFAFFWFGFWWRDGRWMAMLTTIKERKIENWLFSSLGFALGLAQAGYQLRLQ